MLVPQIHSEQFSSYPPQAKHIATGNIALLQQLPLAFLPLLLREIIVYDWKFPAERDEIDRQIRYLGSLTADQLSGTMSSFARLKLSTDLEGMNWINAPERFSEKLSACLWATHQIDDFGRAAEEYIRVFNAAVPEAPIPAPRLGIAVIAQEISRSSNYPLFRKLRRKGVYFGQVDAGSNYNLLLETVAARAQAHPSPYAHWCIEGAQRETPQDSPVASLAYDSLKPVRKQLIHKMQRVSASQSGPEILRTRMAETEPSELGMQHLTNDPVLSRFAISVLTEGSGTQIYSTTFVQWTAREALRRARPLTILAKFAARQTEESADEELSGLQQQAVLDPTGSLVDADMGAYYTWMNLQRLSGADQSSFLAWAEGRREAVAIGPSFAPGTQSQANASLAEILRQAQTKG
jgi:hypothetical protein